MRKLLRLIVSFALSFPISFVFAEGDPTDGYQHGEVGDVPYETPAKTQSVTRRSEGISLGDFTMIQVAGKNEVGHVSDINSDGKFMVQYYSDDGQHESGYVSASDLKLPLTTVEIKKKNDSLSSSAKISAPDSNVYYCDGASAQKAVVDRVFAGAAAGEFLYRLELSTPGGNKNYRLVPSRLVKKSTGACAL